MKKKIETETTITIKIDGQEFYLTQEEARELFFSLKGSLGIVDPPAYPMQPYTPPTPLEPYIPKNPQPDPWIQPGWPTYPGYPQVWCQSNNNTQ